MIQGHGRGRRFPPHRLSSLHEDREASPFVRRLVQSEFIDFAIGAKRDISANPAKRDDACRWHRCPQSIGAIGARIILAIRCQWALSARPATCRCKGKIGIERLSKSYLLLNEKVVEQDLIRSQFLIHHDSCAASGGFRNNNLKVAPFADAAILNECAMVTGEHSRYPTSRGLRPQPPQPERSGSLS